MRPHAARLSALAAPALALSIWSGATAPAQAVDHALAPGWAALPAETIACVRVPDTRGFLNALRDQTVLGQRVLTGERLNGFFNLFKEQNAEGWGAFTSQLQAVGLTADELGELIQEPWGAGWVMAPSDVRATPQNALVFWADLDEERIETLYAALDSDGALSDRAQRTDLELAGCDVRQYAVAQPGAVDDDPARRPHLLVTRMPGRMVAALGVPDRGEAGAPGPVDIEAVHGVLARYLDQTTAGGDAGGFAPRLSANPGIAAATHLGRGDDAPTLAEVYIDVPAIVEFSRATLERSAGPEQAQQYAAVTDALALKGLGALGGSVFSADGGLQIRGFLGAPAPRTGLIGMLDGATLPPAPPAWVPADSSYGHLAFDLGQLWDLTIDIATAAGGPEAAQQMQVANMMAGGMLQTDIQTALRSFGTAHRFVSLPPTADAPTQPFALVWDVADAAVLQRILAFATQQMTAQPGITAAEEQGFTGLRFDQGVFSGGAMLGTNQLVLGAGGGLLERLLTTINTPPASTMAAGRVYRDGEGVLPYRPGFWFQFSDGGRDLVSAARRIMSVVSTNPGVDPETAQKIQDLMPSDDDLRAALGASIAQMRLEDGGLVLEGATATPAAE